MAGPRDRVMSSAGDRCLRPETTRTSAEQGRPNAAFIGDFSIHEDPNRCAYVPPPSFFHRVFGVFLFFNAIVAGGLFACSPASETSAPADAGVPDALAGSPWRSALYPENWTPDFNAGADLFLPDFSYAGYRNGEAEPGSIAAGAEFDVVSQYGADPTGTTDSTSAIQGAIGAAESAGGGIVQFPEGLYRLDGVLTVSASSVVLRGAGPEESRLFFTKDTGLDYSAHIQIRGALSSDLEIPLSVGAESRSFEIQVADAQDLEPGEDIAIGWIITPEFIEEHGMTGTWEAFNDTWQPFFYRSVKAIDKTSTPHRVAIDVPLRYPAKTRDNASLRRMTGYLREVGVERLGISNATSFDAAWAQNQVHAMDLSGIDNGWVREVHSFSSPLAPAAGSGAGAHLQSSGILIKNSKRVTVSDTKMGHAINRGGGGNGYLFEMRQSSELLFRDCEATAGRHNFIQNWGFGMTGSVWLRVKSSFGRSLVDKDSSVGSTGYSEFHHSLATANLIDSSIFDDGVSIVNRNNESTGAGHTGTQNVFWNTRGSGLLRSLQFGMGYVIGTEGLESITASDTPIIGLWTAPDDFTEGLGAASSLAPASLYEDQLKKRLSQAP